MYNWRQMTDVERVKALTVRKCQGHPWHRPPHFDVDGVHSYLLTAACWNHEMIIGQSPDRMAEFESDLIETTDPIAWCILPNHYHLVLQTRDLRKTVRDLGKIHGRSSFSWNGEDQARGRSVWHSCADRRIRNESHLWATINYVHHNPVRHGYCDRWQEWPYSSASSFLESEGRSRALEIWNRYPPNKFGDGWDNF
jgi:putative transposase